jgi:hypothetical protein
MADIPLLDDPWAVTPDDFHAGAPAASRLAHLAHWAALAPSSHNTQPWRFVVQGEELRLFADRARALPVVDPDDRALLMSCGAALGQLRVAAAALGEALSVTLPDRGGSYHGDLLATVTALGPVAPEADGLARLAALLGRRTTRRPFVMEALPQGLALALDAAVAGEGAQLALVQGIQVQEQTLAQLYQELQAVEVIKAELERELIDSLSPVSLL